MGVKKKIIGGVLFILLMWFLFRVEVDVEESDLIGSYYTKPYKLEYNGKLNIFSDSLILSKDNKTFRSEFINGQFSNKFVGSWKNWNIDGRYSVGIDIYSNDILPRKRLLTGDVYFEIGHKVFYKTDR